MKIFARSLTTLLALLMVAVATPAPAASNTSSAPAVEDGLVTVAEQSKFVRTGRYDEVQRLCGTYMRAWPDSVRCGDFGRTPEGRPMFALVASRTGALSAGAARERGLPVILIQGGIHAGEIDGKDAGFMALRELLGRADTLRNFVVVFVPVFNVDGHERFGRWNRPNQVGPEEMGWRGTGQNLNLNRDYTKADAPEMQAMLRLLNAWDPVLYVDLHVTDGSNFQHDVSNTIDPSYSGDPALQPLAKALVTQLNAKMTALGSHPLDFYPELVKDNDPSAGFARDIYSPRYSTAYWGLHNRFGLLVETHSWKDYATRVRVTHNIIVTLADMMSREGASWRKQTLAADDRAAQLGGQTVALDFENGPHVTMIDFLGYAYTRWHSEVSGAMAVRYDATKPEVWHVPLRDTVVVKTSTQAPRGGYVVTAANADWMAAKLALHGIRFSRVARTVSPQGMETFRATKVTYSKEPFEGHTRLTIEGSWKAERRSVLAGALFVPIAQPNARLAVALLDPQGVDSFAAWGFFATAFEAKEYMEDYVAEQVGAGMLARDPAVAAEFKKRVAEDPEFAGSPAARLEFFYRRSASWDERLNLYPVYRVAGAP